MRWALVQANKTVVEHYLHFHVGLELGVVSLDTEALHDIVRLRAFEPLVGLLGDTGGSRSSAMRVCAAHSGSQPILSDDMKSTAAARVVLGLQIDDDVLVRLMPPMVDQSESCSEKRYQVIEPFVARGGCAWH